MQHEWIDGYLMGKPGVNKNFQADWGWHRYYVADKMFAAVCMTDSGAFYCLTFKLPPDEGELMRSQHPDVIPGYYMNKVHWNSVMAGASIDEALVKIMLDHAWTAGLHALSQKKQHEILGDQ